MTCRCYEKVGMANPCWLNVVDGPFSWRDTARLVKYRHVWERMGSGGPRGPQNRCEACKTSWMCSIHIRSRQRILPTTTKVPVLFVVVWTMWTKQLRNTRSCSSGGQRAIYLHRNQNETSARCLIRNFVATVRYYPYSIKLTAHGAPRTTPFFSINWRKHELHAESSRRAQGPLSRAA